MSIAVVNVLNILNCMYGVSNHKEDIIRNSLIRGK